MKQTLIPKILTLALLFPLGVFGQSDIQRNQYLGLSAGNSIGLAGIPITVDYGIRTKKRLELFGSLAHNITSRENVSVTSLGGGIRILTKEENVFSLLKVQPFTETSIHLWFTKDSYSGSLAPIPMPRISFGSYIGGNELRKGIIKFNLSLATFLEAGYVFVF